MAAIDAELVEPAAPAPSARERLTAAIGRVGLAADPLQPVLVAFGEAIDTATDRVSRAATAVCEAANRASGPLAPSVEAAAVQRMTQALGDGALVEIERLATAVTLRRRAMLGCTAAILAIALMGAGYIAALGATASIYLAIGVHGWLAVREVGDAVIAGTAACFAFWLMRLLPWRRG